MQRPRQRKGPPPSIREVSLRLLSFRDHSAEQLRRKLVRRGFETPAVDAEIAFLSERGLLDDTRWATQAARTRLRARYGRRRIEWELSAAGIDAESRGAALDHALEEEDEMARLRELAERRVDSIRRRHGAEFARSDAARTKIASHLLQRGYDASSIIEILDEVLRRLADTEPDQDNRRSHPTGDDLHHDHDHE